MADKGYSGRQAKDIAGVTYRQLDYWARTDLLKPSIDSGSGSGSRRVYSYNDLVVLRLIKSMLDSGIRLESIREVVNYIRDDLGQDVGEADIVIDGKSVVLTTSENELIDLVRRGQGMLTILSFSRVQQELDNSIEALVQPDQLANQSKTSGGQAQSQSL